MIFLFAELDRFLRPCARALEIAVFRISGGERAQNMGHDVHRSFSRKLAVFERFGGVAVLVVGTGSEQPGIVVQDARVFRIDFEQFLVESGRFGPVSEEQLHIGERAEQVGIVRALFELRFQNCRRALVFALFRNSVRDLRRRFQFALVVFGLGLELFEGANGVFVSLLLHEDDSLQTNRGQEVPVAAKRLVGVVERLFVIARLSVERSAQEIEAGTVEFLNEARVDCDSAVEIVDRREELTFFHLEGQVVLGACDRFVKEGARFVETLNRRQEERFFLFVLGRLRIEFDRAIDLLERFVGSTDCLQIRGILRIEPRLRFRFERDRLFDKWNRGVRVRLENSAEDQRERLHFFFGVFAVDRQLERLFRVFRTFCEHIETAKRKVGDRHIGILSKRRGQVADDAVAQVTPVVRELIDVQVRVHEELRDRKPAVETRGKAKLFCIFEVVLVKTEFLRLTAQRDDFRQVDKVLRRQFEIGR